MRNVEQIRSDIIKLPRQERVRLAKWFQEFDEEAWDREIAADYASGELDALLQEVDQDIKAGHLRDGP